MSDEPKAKIRNESPRGTFEMDPPLKTEEEEEEDAPEPPTVVHLNAQIIRLVLLADPSVYA
jgi:hypothetical protein